MGAIFEIPGFGFHPSRFTLPSHASSLFLSKSNPYNLILCCYWSIPKRNSKASYAILLEHVLITTENAVHINRSIKNRDVIYLSKAVIMVFVPSFTYT